MKKFLKRLWNGPPTPAEPEAPEIVSNGHVINNSVSTSGDGSFAFGRVESDYTYGAYV